MAQEINSQAIAKKIYEKDSKNLLKSVVEKTKETEEIRATLEMAMTGLDNDGRFSVLSQINQKLDKGDQAFFDANGVNIEKIKSFALETSKKVFDEKKEKMQKEDINKKANGEDKVQQDNKAKLEEEKRFNEKKDELSPFIKKLSEDSQRIITSGMLRIEDAEAKIEVLMAQGMSREEALNEVYKGNIKLINKHKLGIRAKMTMEKAKNTGQEKDSKDAQTAMDEYSIVEISSEIEKLTVEIEKYKIALNSTEKKLTPEESQRLQQQIKEIEGRLEALKLDRKKLEKTLEENAKTNLSEQEENDVIENSKKIDNPAESVKAKFEVPTTTITKISDIKLLVKDSVSAEQVVSALKVMKEAFSADDREEFENIINEATKEEEKDFFEMLKRLDYGEDIEKILTGSSQIDIFDSIDEIITEIEQEHSKEQEEISGDVSPITDANIDQGINNGTLQQEELVVDTASVRTAYGDDEGTINVEVIDAGQVEQGENVKPLKSVSSFMGLISNEKEKLSESDLGEAVTEVEVASQKFEQDRQAAQGNIDPQQANLAQEQLINEEDLEQ